jgi:predicted ATP-dependent serine protease
MAKTITCKHCQGTVAKNADKCPHCGGWTTFGAVTTALDSAGNMVLLVFVLALLGGIFVLS